MKLVTRTAASMIVGCCISALVLASPGMAFEKQGAALVASALGASPEAPFSDDLATDVAIDVPAIVAIPVPLLPTAVDAAPAPVVAFASLGAAVAAQDVPGTMSAELECLAAATYFESKGEPLEGQLAVAEVILNRASSGRFASTLCGVVHQRGQFSFVRGGRMPPIARSSRAWREAVAVAQVAMADAWESSLSNALFFHARRVSPGWRLKRVGTLGNHVFYR